MLTTKQQKSLASVGVALWVGYSILFTDQLERLIDMSEALLSLL